MAGSAATCIKCKSGHVSAAIADMQATGESENQSRDFVPVAILLQGDIFCFYKTMTATSHCPKENGHRDDGRSGRPAAVQYRCRIQCCCSVHASCFSSLALTASSSFGK